MEWNDVVHELSGAAASNGAVMVLDLARVADAPGPPIVGVAIGVLQECTGARTVGELAGMDDVEGILRAELPRGERRAFVRAFATVVRRLASESPRTGVDRAAAKARDAAAPGFDPSRVPDGGEELDAWVRRFGVEDILGRAVRFKHGPRAKDVAMIPVRECIDLVRYPDLRRDLGVPRDQFRRPAEEALVRIATENAPLLARRAAFVARRTAPDDAWLAERVRLLSELAQTRGFTGQAPLELTYPNVTVDFRANPLTFVVTDKWRQTHAVDLARATFTNMGGAWLGSEERARSDVALLECAIDALCDPEGKAVRELLAWRAVPEWRHMLGAFEEAAVAVKRLRSVGEEEERLAFRLPLDLADVPAVLVQKARKGGASFTAGRQEGPSAALALPGLSALEREILEMLGLLQHASTYRRREHVHARLRLFDLLSEHPRVHLEGANAATVRLRRVRATLRVSPTASCFRTEIGVGGAALGPADALARSRATGILAAADPGERVVSFAEIDDVSSALFAALAAHPDDLPGEGLDALLGVLAQFSSVTLDLDLPEEARGKPVAADPRLVVQLSLAGEGSLALALRVRALPGGVAALPGAPPRHAYGTGPDRVRVFATRDLDAEEARAEHLLGELPLAGSARHGAFDVRIDDPDRACDVVATLAEMGDAIVTEWPAGQRIRVASTLDRRSLKLRIARARKQDWFGIEGGAEVEGTTVGIHALLEAVRTGRRFVRLENGALAALGRDLRTHLSRADDVLQDTQGGLAAHPPAVAAVCALVEDEEKQLAAVREWRELRARMKRAQTFEPTLPAGLTAELRPYQVDGFRWLMRLAACGSGGCLADDMGLGKTLQSLAVLLSRKDDGPALVVAPTSVCANWAAEAARFAGGLEMISYRGAGRRALLDSLRPGTVLVTSYDLMFRDIDALEACSFSTAIFDEAHALKNGSSKRAVAARRIRADVRVALSGTPVENHTGELWSLFRVVVPGLFGSWERFRERFAAPIERDRDATRRAALAAVIRPYLLRRTKREVAPELPPRTDVVRYVDFSAPERELYELERLRAVDAVKSGGAGEDARFAILAALTRLRQLACHPRLRHPASTAPSAKLASVLSLIEELRDAGHRALVFSQFTSHLAIVAEALRASGVTYLELDGSTPAEARADRVRRFQDGEADLFLISLKAGGLGLNLTAADYVLHLDPWWNPAAEDQASDRAHRIGQDKPVTVVRFIARGTIEESVLALHGEKRELSLALLAGGDVAARLSTRELLALMEKSAAGEAEESGEDGDTRDE